MNLEGRNLQNLSELPMLVLLACSPEALAIPHAPPSGAVRTRVTPPIVAVATLERAPFDARSVTQSFAMWEATAPPDGFTWGYDTRYAEMYEQEANKPVVGVPSVGGSVWSWFDSGVRLSAAEEPAAALVAKEATASAPAVSEGTITLTPEQVKAFGEPAVRALTDAVADAPAAEATITLTAEQVKAFGEPAVRTLTDAADGASVADEATITLTAEQVKAFGGSAVRTLTAV